MIERALMALAVLLSGLPGVAGNRVAPDGQGAAEAIGTAAAPAQTKETHPKPKTGEREIVKYIDFTRPKRKPTRDAPKAGNHDAVTRSSAVVKATSYTVRGKTYRTLSTRQLDAFHQKGPASWYGPGFHGRKTASGEVYDMHAMTAAHKRLPLGTKVKVTNLDNGKSVVVRINDRGPFYGNRILDLSKAAAGKIGAIEKGVAKVSIVVLR